MAGDLELTPLLIGLGLDELSASTGQIPCLKEAVRRLNHADCAALAKAATQGLGATAIYERSKALARSCYADLLD
jgi:phosphotransferase system enzyme I (PtsI)